MFGNAEAPAIRCVYSWAHALQNAEHEVQCGVKIQTYDRPERAESIREALSADPVFQLLDPEVHGLGHITAVHDPGLVDFLRDAWSQWREYGGLQGGPTGVDELFPDTILHPALREGMGPAPEPKILIGRMGYWCWETMTALVQGSYAAALAAVDVSLTAADQVLAGQPFAYGLVRPSGHHSPRRAFGGNCFFNNAAVVAQYLVSSTEGRVAILDVDYHHGNGTQQIFYDREEVLYCSIHADPDYAYPYFAGHASETGVGPGAHTTLNLPLATGCTDATYLRALHQALERIVECSPDILVISLGLDTYRLDPIGDFKLTTDLFHAVGGEVRALGLPTVVLQEGGYYVPALGENVRQWLRGLAGAPALASESVQKT